MFKMTYICANDLLFDFFIVFMKTLQILVFGLINWISLTVNNVTESVDLLTKNLSDIPTQQNVHTLEEVLNIVLSLVGGILSSIVLTFLKNKFPNLFARTNYNRKRVESVKLKNELN